MANQPQHSRLERCQHDGTQLGAYVADAAVVPPPFVGDELRFLYSAKKDKKGQKRMETTGSEKAAAGELAQRVVQDVRDQEARFFGAGLCCELYEERRDTVIREWLQTPELSDDDRAWICQQLDYDRNAEEERYVGQCERCGGEVNAEQLGVSLMDTTEELCSWCYQDALL